MIVKEPDLVAKDGYYLKDNVYYPRVTRILEVIAKPELAVWRGRVGNMQADAIANVAKDFGTDFHSLCKDINQGAHLKRGWVVEDRLRRMALLYIDWLHENIESIQVVESTLYNDEEGKLFGGTPDLVATFRGDKEPSLIDIKTSSKPSLDWPLQLSAYRLMLLKRMPIHKRVILRVPKKDEPIETFTYMDHDDDEEAWWHAYHLWTWAQQKKERLKKSKAPRKRKS